MSIRVPSITLKLENTEAETAWTHDFNSNLVEHDRIATLFSIVLSFVHVLRNPQQWLIIHAMINVFAFFFLFELTR